ncbi:DUF4350 domain-containing protein [Cellulophaga sp. HaHaR_3_176]|uniref:DUF4350 domain-containing protein n=1 Tax=Cellulophaga sp. HaHaR_3_176 TaxID=1942464 RepID=UPI001C1F798A|nr:DUF4350 domain-containing protein [Cellulophaga sp. HaHaR_3_176]QWX84673.1 DUF4350 domain-containing protein [Cellulophaga sp. HaHaR_3_176]
MRKKGTIYFIIGAIALALLLFLEYNKKKEINWFPSYVTHHKIPFGTKVLMDILELKFTSTTLVEKPPFEFLPTNDDVGSTYLFINENVAFGKTELDDALSWAAKGNTLFIASTSFEDRLLDTLHLKTASLYGDEGLQHQFNYKLVNKKLNSKKSYSYKKDYNSLYFSKIDTLQTVILGEVTNTSEGKKSTNTNISTIQQKFGDGTIILTTFPKAFTNYFILKDQNKDYTAGLLSYINNDNPLYIDAYYKSGKTYYTSPLYLFLSNKEFKWAYYIVIIGALFYVIFEGKRKQRAIAVLKPLENQTLAFTRTIADMYYEKGETKPIAEHKITYFLEYIRSSFYLKTEEWNTDFYTNLASRSNHTLSEVESLFSYLQIIKKRHTLTNEELQKLNTSIEQFKSKAHGK